jgi:ABC-type glycerol-3-phosphate transport system substrate-binding protein
VRHPGRGTFVASGAWEAEMLRAAEDIRIVVPDERWCWPLQQAAALWNEEFPRQPVRLQFRIVGPVQLRTQLALSVAQGAAADISIGDSVWVAEFAERGYVRSLTAINAELAAAITADLVPALRTQSTFHGEIYAIPGDADFALLWYRRDWFEREGIAPPRTWDEWLTCARHFQKPAVRTRYAIGPHSFAFAGGGEAGEATTYQLLPVLWSTGADVIANHEVVLNSGASQAAVGMITDMVRKYGVAGRDVVKLPWNGPALAFASGSAAMTIGGSYEGRIIRAAAGWDVEEFRNKVGFMPIPAGPGGSQATVLGGLSYTIYSQSQRAQLGLELVARATRPDVLKDFCIQTGQNPATISGAVAIEQHDEPFLSATSHMFAYARPRWPIPEYTRVSLQIQRMFESAITGELEPDAAVARAATVIAGITGLPERGTSWRPTREKIARN